MAPTSSIEQAVDGNVAEDVQRGPNNRRVGSSLARWPRASRRALGAATELQKSTSNANNTPAQKRAHASDGAVPLADVGAPKRVATHARGRQAAQINALVGRGRATGASRAS